MTSVGQTGDRGREAPPRRSILRRVGGLAVSIAVLTLGVGAGLVLGSPTSAAGTGAIEVRMPGQSSFGTAAPEPLLNIGDLVPGGAVAGTMLIRDSRGTDSHDDILDTLTLQMIDVASRDACDATATCHGAGAALSDALSLTLDVSDPATGDTLAHSVETVDSLRDGVTLASELVTGDVVSMTLSASLPAAAGNAVADGTLSFALRLGLISVASTSDDGADDDNGPGTGGSADGGVIGVLDTRHSQVPATGGGVGPDRGDVLVLGRPDEGLSYTGVPIVVLLSVGGLALIAGVGFLFVARRRT